MAEIFLSQVGAAVGSAALPNGISALGLTLSGAAIGRAAGTYIGARIDDAVFGSGLNGPRPKSVYLAESREGAGLPLVYGRARVAGQVIWMANPKEIRSEQSVGGKGGPSVSQYRYTLSFAMALCEGEILRVDRAWANGDVLALSEVNHRVYSGTDDQLPDPVIEAIEGAGRAPAYRGTAYVVFEDFPLEAFGNRLPQLSFEVVRGIAGSGAVPFSDSVKAVNLIPASGEFVYATEIVRRREFPGHERAINMNNADGRADVLVSLDQLRDELPNVTAVSLTVGWFGLSLEAGTCEIRPGVETREVTTVPWGWHGGGIGRAEAHLVSQDEAGRALYGGTPDDRSVVQLIRELKARGYDVTITPFLFMDTEGFPWRGRMTTAAADGSAGVRGEIEAFLGGAAAGDFALSADGFGASYTGPAEWSYRRFVLHLAALAKQAGGVSAFLVGSEMVGLTRRRDDAGAFPFVDGLVSLAGEVRALLGPGTEMSYAADWTEYGAYAPGDGSGDVLFPLDPFWAHPEVGFVGVDWYPPMGDWRDGAGHVDALAGYFGPTDVGYLAAQVEGGEAYDWFYADEAARVAQVRSTISDSALGEDWVFRAKDVRGWWGSDHHPRPGGVRAASPTGWQAGMKPVRFCEIGFPAVDRGANQPNVFYDPKSSESAFPHFSRGTRDDGAQRAALAAVDNYWFGEGADNPFLAGMSVWAWDARPFPDFPVRGAVWSDGDNWAFGHWLNGRSGLVTLDALVGDLAERAGVSLNAGGLYPAVQGYVVDGPASLRNVLEPLQTAFGFVASEVGGELRLAFPAEAAAGVFLSLDDTVELEPGESIRLERELIDRRPDGLRLGFVDLGAAFEAGEVEVGEAGSIARRQVAMAFPLVMTGGAATDLAERLLDELGAGLEMATCEAVGTGFALTPGDRVEVEGLAGDWRVEAVSLQDAARLTLRRSASADWPAGLGVEPGAVATAQLPGAAPDLVVMDLPAGRGVGPVVAAFADPWPGRVPVRAGAAGEASTARAELATAALIGRLTEALESGPTGRWDEAGVIEMDVSGTEIASRSKADVLNGANRLALETGLGWELVGFREVEWLGGRRVRLSGLLRGLGGSDRATGIAAVGARVVILDGAERVAEINPDELGLERIWTANGASSAFTWSDDSNAPWRPGHFRAAIQTNSDLHLTWTPRGADISDGWDAADPVRVGVTFVLEFVRSGSVIREIVVQAPEHVYAVAEQSSDLADHVRVREVSPDGRRGAAAELALE